VLRDFPPQGLAGGLTAQKKQREVYVGNLTIGVVTDNHLKELFNGALSHLVPDPHSNPPVVSAQLDPSGEHPPTPNPLTIHYRTDSKCVAV
jgi:hypothetical protein